MSYTSNGAVLRSSEAKSLLERRKRIPNVQKGLLAYDAKHLGDLRTVAQVLDSGLLPIGDVAALLGIEVKRLRGYIFRNGIGDPIGDFHSVYGWSCKTLSECIAVTSSAKHEGS